VYRRWPTKGELVLTAFIEGVHQAATPPETGTLRGDLMQLGEPVCEHASQHASTIRAVLVEVSRNPALNCVMQHQFIDQRKALIQQILRHAISDEVWDLLPSYLIFRSIMASRPPNPGTIEALVDDVIIPSLTRPT